MSKSFLSLLFTLFTLVSVTAQDDAAERKASLSELYKKEGIFLSPRYWVGNTYVKQGVWAPVGAFGRGLAPDMALSPSGKAKMAEAQRNFIGAQVVTAFSCLGYLAIANRDHDNADYSRADFNNQMTVLGLVVAMDALVVKPLMLRGQRKLHQAVWLRNRDLLFGQSASNDPLLDIYNREAIQLYPTYWGNAKYMKNNKLYNATGYGGALGMEFAAVPEARVLYETARKNREASNVSGLISGGLMVGGYSMVFSGFASALRNDGNNDRSALQRMGTGLGLTLVGAVANLAISIPLKFKSERQLSEAVYLRNQAILFGN